MNGIAPGELNRRITILRSNRIDDGTATVDGPLEPVGQRFAKRTDVSDAERVRAAENAQELSTRFLVRSDPLTRSINGRDALWCEGLTYSVSGTKEFGGRRVGIEITAMARPDLVIIHQFAGMLAAHSALSGAAFAVGRVSGTLAARAIVTGSLTARARLRGALVASSGVSGAVVARARPGASLASQSYLAGAMAITGILLSLSAGTLIPSVTFTRTTVGRYTDSAGTTQVAAINTPRWDYDPVSLALRGILIEPQRTNLLINSADLTQASYARLACTAPTATTLIEDTTNARHYERPTGSGQFQITAGTTYTFSFLVSELGVGAKRYFGVLLDLTGFTGTRVTTFDLATGTIGQTTAGATGKITNKGAGRWLCEVTAVADGTIATGTYQACISNAANSALTTFVGDGVSGFNFHYTQVEVGPYATSYIPTTTAQAIRGGDVMSRVLGPEFNPAAQTALFKCRWDHTLADGVTTKRLWQWDDGTSANRILLQIAPGGLVQLITIVNSITLTQQAGPTLNAASANADYRFGIGFGQNLTRLVVNGTAYADAAPASMPPLSTRRIGSDSGGTNQTGGWLTPYLPHPTLGYNVSEANRLYSVAEMIAITS